MDDPKTVLPTAVIGADSTTLHYTLLLTQVYKTEWQCITNLQCL